MSEFIALRGEHTGGGAARKRCLQVLRRISEAASSLNIVHTVTVVGGAARDARLGLSAPADYDVAIQVSPEDAFEIACYLDDEAQQFENYGDDVSQATRGHFQRCWTGLTKFSMVIQGEHILVDLLTYEGDLADKVASFDCNLNRCAVTYFGVLLGIAGDPGIEQLVFLPEAPICRRQKMCWWYARHVQGTYAALVLVHAKTVLEEYF